MKYYNIKNSSSPDMPPQSVGLVKSYVKDTTIFQNKLIFYGFYKKKTQ